MGRGRAKAKQTRVARELKYRSVSTDFTSLERELRGSASDIPDAYSDLAQQYGVEVEDDEEYDDEFDEDDEDDVDVDEHDGPLQMRRSG